MTYHIIKHIVKIAIRCYYRRIKIRNHHKIPINTPLLISANHTNAFMDSLILSVFLKQKVTSLPRGDIFFSASRIKKWFFNKIGMIPIYRAIEGTQHLHKNKSTFTRCHEVLAKKGTIQIFPEAICIQERRLKPMKKGAARIVFGAEESRNFTIGTQLIFVGMNYEKAWKFNGDIFLNYSRPYSTSKFIIGYKENKAAGINELTKFIGEKLKQQIVHIDDPSLDHLVEIIELVYTGHLAQEYSLSADKPEHQFLISREIANGINYFYAQNPEEIVKLKASLHHYYEKLKLDGIADGFIAAPPLKKEYYLHLLFLSVTFPFYLYGIVNNFIPAKITVFSADKVVKTTEFYNSVVIVSGMLGFLFFYLLQTLIVGILSHSFIIIIAYVVLLPLSGKFVFLYLQKWNRINAMITFFNAYKSSPHGIDELRAERKNIIKELSTLKSKFRNRFANGNA